MTYDWISFTSDYGLDDGFVAACTGVIARITPRVRVLHVTHRVPPQDIRRGATVLAQIVPYLPPAVHLAVVDPGVGTDRGQIALVSDGGVLVGPDNGLLVPAAEALGGIESAYELTDPTYRLSTVSATFHGRDVFAPAAAHLAAGTPPNLLGPAVDPADLVRLPEPKIVVQQGKLASEILSTDNFGNIQLAARLTDLAACGATPGSGVRVHIRDHEATAVLGRTFADVDRVAMVVLVDSAGHVAIAVNGGSAAAVLGCLPGDTIVLHFADR